MPTKGHMGKPPATDIFAAYRYDMQARGIKPHSMVTYDRVVSLFGDFLVETGMPVDDVRRPDIQRFLMETGWAPSTQRTALAYLRAAYGYAVEELELFDRNPCRRVRLARIIKEIPRTIPNERLRAMRDACRHDGDWLTLGMFMYTGMRTIEVRRLTWNDVSLSEGAMRVFGKGDKWRIVPIHQRLRRILIGRTFDHGSVHVVPGRHVFGDRLGGASHRAFGSPLRCLRGLFPDMNPRVMGRLSGDRAVGSRQAGLHGCGQPLKQRSQRAIVVRGCLAP
jgi:integrase